MIEMRSPADKLLRHLATMVTLGCLLVLGGTAAVLASYGRAPASPAGYAVGETVDLPEAVYTEDDATLVLIARSACGASQAGKPFFAEMIAKATRLAGIGAVMVSGRTAQEDERRFAKAVGLADSALVRIDLTALRVKEVPTMLLVDRTGRILHLQSGLPDEAAQKALMKALDDVAVER